MLALSKIGFDVTLIVFIGFRLCRKRQKNRVISNESEEDTSRDEGKQPLESYYSSTEALANHRLKFSYPTKVFFCSLCEFVHLFF